MVGSHNQTILQYYNCPTINSHTSNLLDKTVTLSLPHIRSLYINIWVAGVVVQLALGERGQSWLCSASTGCTS